MEMMAVGSEVGKAPTWMPANSSGLRVDGRWVLLLMSLGLILLVALLFSWPQWALMVLAVVFPAGGFGVRMWCLRRYAELEREFNMKMVSGDTAGMLRVYRQLKRIALALPPWLVQSKLGMIFSAKEEWAESERVLEETYEQAPARARLRLMGPLARAKYELGRYDELLSLAAEWRTRSPFAGQPSLYLAVGHAYAAAGERGMVAQLLDEAGELTQSLERRLADEARRGARSRVKGAR
jgi:hypothetical protein